MRCRADLPAGPLFEPTGLFSNGSPILRFPESFRQPQAPPCMTTRSLCLDGRYLINNPAWHVEESAKQIVRMLRRNRISHSNVYSTELAREAMLWVYEISHQANELARNRADERLQFRRRDFRDVKDAYFELILGLDVIEHLQDYFGFLLPLEGEGPPQDFSHSPGSFGANRMAQRRAAQT